MVTIDPMAIKGQWNAGFTLDRHTISSRSIGYDEYGHRVYDTKRTELGELLYRLKYASDYSVADEIVDTISGFVGSWHPKLTMIVPMPPSDKGRGMQPVLVIAQALGQRLGLPVSLNAVVKVKKTPQLKNVYDYKERVRLLDQAFTADSGLLSGQNVLLFDDLYRSGATMESVTRALFEQGHAAEVYALAVTRTKHS